MGREALPPAVQAVQAVGRSSQLEHGVSRDVDVCGAAEHRQYAQGVCCQAAVYQECCRRPASIHSRHEALKQGHSALHKATLVRIAQLLVESVASGTT